ncbi:uncharacterized protein LOC123516115 [Portunus trituberculatus]|uniref:uncharacterized protein LOC123516115 n=1 Tax=Portunus trituberculatus TaxID=210409 RepID=UPI001E1D0513|nr:uncharacterized protein LOC123516115 [Portunus trituberculatus]
MRPKQGGKFRMPAGLFLIQIPRRLHLRSSHQAITDPASLRSPVSVFALTGVTCKATAGSLTYVTGVFSWGGVTCRCCIEASGPQWTTVEHGSTAGERLWSC